MPLVFQQAPGLYSPLEKPPAGSCGISVVVLTRRKCNDFHPSRGAAGAREPLLAPHTCPWDRYGTVIAASFPLGAQLPGMAANKDAWLCRLPAALPSTSRAAPGLGPALLLTLSASFPSHEAPTHRQESPFLWSSGSGNAVVDCYVLVRW